MQYMPLPTDDVVAYELAPRPKKIPRNLTRRPLLLFLILSVLFLGYLAIANDLRAARLGSSAIDSIASSLKLHNSRHIIVIDAGSTGTRLLVFTFHSSIINGDLVLDDESFEEVKPGLSSYSENPKEVVESLQRLLDKAKSVIPRESWGQTPLSLKATAGLRLLPDAKASLIIEEARNFFQNSGFLVTLDAISIMGGADEGIFAWFTVNFLLNRLSSSSSHPGNTVAVLDLGGASTQVTYAPDEDDLKKLDNHVYTINALNRNLSIYTNSYLGMGLKAARRSILEINFTEEVGGRAEVRSDCINPIIDTEWSYGGRDYKVKGAVNGSYKIVKTQNYGGSDEKRPIVKMEDCRGLVKKFVDGITERPVGLNKYEIYGVSHYFDRATEAGLVDPFRGGVITLNAFYKATVHACNDPNTDQPFACLDMMYIHVLLKDCFGLEASTKLNLYKKYEGHEMSWALGAAFSIYQTDL